MKYKIPKIFSKKEVKKLANRKEINPYKMYGDLLYSKKTKGLTEVIVPLDKTSVQLGYNRVVSKDEIHYYLQVSKMNSTLDSNLLSLARNNVRVQYGRQVYIDLISKSKPHKVKWNSNAMKSNKDIWQRWRKKEAINKDEADSVGFAEDSVGEMYNRGQWREASWQYLKESEREGTAISITNIIFRVRIPKEDEDHAYILFSVLNEVFNTLDLTVRHMNTCLYDLLNEISPFKHEESKLSSMFISDRVLTTKVVSAFTPITQGRLNNGMILLGNDIMNRHGVYLNTHPKGHGGTNGILIGATGAGKSYIMKVILEQILAHNDYTYITDYEGNEYTELGKTYGATFLDLKGHDGKYYEPMRLCTLTGIDDIDNDILSLSIRGIYELLDVLLGHSLTATQKNILSKVITEYYNGFGVDADDKNTWIFSKDMTVRGLLPKIKAYAKSKEMMNRYGANLVELADTMELYFEGVYSYMFKNPVSFDELKDKKCIITRFGAFNTGSVTGGDSVDLKLKQLTMIQLNSELSRYRRSRGESFIVVYEELQRYLEHTGSVEWINASWTGIRKCNGSCFGIINDPSKLNSNISALINNSEFFIIGKTKDIEGLSYVFKTPNLEGTEDLVRSLLNLNNCFLFKHEDTLSIFRCETPKAYHNSPIFKTRNDEVS